jgi:starch synthase
MKVLFATAEALPYFKTGGLADVGRSLPDALVAAGHDVRLVLPAYGFLAGLLGGARRVCRLAVPWPGGHRPADVLLHAPPSGAAAVFIRPLGFFNGRRPYEPVAGDPLSLGRRFAFFCRAVAAYARHEGMDVVHLNDWQTGLVPLFGLMDGLDAATLFTIHNLAYQGNFDPRLVTEAGIAPEFMRTENGLEFYGQASFMKAGIALADRVSTVSPTHAREIRTQEYGAGLHGLLTFRRRVLHGVLNGIDTETWDPERDPFLPARYKARDLAGRQAIRRELVSRTGLSGDGPILGMVTRLVWQKGIDVLLATIPEIVRQGCRVVILGHGEPGYEHALAAVAAEHPGSVVVQFGFDEPLAHLVYAGADLFLMPSMYEPCGLGQLIAQRYGTPPVARRTGGLADTIEDGVTGFLFDEPTAEALAAAVRRACDVRRTPLWPALQAACMRLDHSWRTSARQYEHLYHLALGTMPAAVS